MGMRITQQMITAKALIDLHRQTRKILDLQEELATGLKVNNPSDDPLAARRAINIRSSISKNEQYMANISAIGPQLLETTTAVQTVQSAIQRARELALQGANGTLNQKQLDQIAIEVNQLLEGIFEQSNHTTNGRYIFGGTRTLSAPFEATRDANGEITAVTYTGNDEDVEIQVADGASVIINETGSRAFQSNQDVFQLLIDIRDNLRSGNQTALQGDRLNELKTAQDQLLISMARIGSTQNRLDRLGINLENFTDLFRETLSDNIDADYADTIINLNTQQNAFQAALNAAARAIQPSLLDFIR